MQPMRPSDRELKALLAEDVPYDVEEGLRRHQRSIATGAVLPDWAHEVSPPRHAGTLQRWWWLSTLVLGGVLYLGVRPTPRRAPVRAPVQQSAPTPQVTALGAPIVEPLQRPSVQPLESSRAPAPTVEAHDERDEPSPVARPNAPRSSSSDAPIVASKPRSEARGKAATPPLESHGEGVTASRRARASDPLDAEEMRQLSEAEQRLPADPLQTLKLVRAGEVEFKNGYFTQERRYLEIMALYALGRHEEASAHAAWFLRDYPDGPYRRKVELAQQKHR